MCNSVEVLKRLAVRASAIRVLRDRHVNTADEIRTIERELRAAGANRVILVTSKYHSRRVRAFWRALVGSEPNAIVRYASGNPFEPNTGGERPQTRWPCRASGSAC